jgi:hypothetical protein
MYLEIETSQVGIGLETNGRIRSGSEFDQTLKEML